MIGITNHCKHRYVERIKNISGYNEIRQYAVQNDEIISEHINKLFEYSTFLYKGSIEKSKPINNFHINSHIVLVLDQNKECIITIYKVDFGFPERTNKLVIKDLINEVEDISFNIKYDTEQLDAFREQEEVKLEAIELEINQLQDKIKNLVNQKEEIEEDIISRKVSIDMQSRKAEKYIKMLCDSKSTNR